jgi:hypothetical protein
MLQRAERERASRSPRWIDASVRSRTHPRIEAVISNISDGGCRIEAAAEFAVGEAVEIMVPRLGSISAIIRWSEAGHSGAAFVPGSDSWLVADPGRLASSQVRDAAVRDF